MQVLWMTWEMFAGAEKIAEKSASGPEAIPMPSDASSGRALGIRKEDCHLG